MSLKLKIFAVYLVIQCFVIIKLCIAEMNTPIIIEDNLQQASVDMVDNCPITIKHLIATQYNAVTDQCDSDPLITAGMYKINPKKASKHKWVALSRNLLKRWGGRFDYGDMIKISNVGHKNGIYKVVDTMNKRFKNRIDFLETEGTPWYVFHNAKIQKVK